MAVRAGFGHGESKNLKAIAVNGTGQVDVADVTAYSQAVMDFLEVGRNNRVLYNRRMQRMSEMNLPTWVEDPTPALMNVKQFLQKGGGFNLEAERGKVAEARLAAEKKVMEKVPQEQQGWFTQLMRLAQKSGVFSEEHDRYLSNSRPPHH